MQENTYKHLNEDCQAIIKTSKEKKHQVIVGI